MESAGRDVASLEEGWGPGSRMADLDLVGFFLVSAAIFFAFVVYFSRTFFHQYHNTMFID
jgi:hypothetical protein